ncbi:MAG TPA: ABC transporter ATP-binding protein [Candidatus Dormibacteraeota bacterium]|nr:ABC transporter ATP-binding protein [Candidatus Dormibacteraeota bacterium]
MAASHNGLTTAIRTVGLTKDYGDGHGVFDLDLQVHAGEVFGFIGPNGAGKTTTIRLLMDLVRADRGIATIYGLDSRRDSVAVKRITGYLPGELPSFAGFTGGQLLELFANLRGGVALERMQTLADRFQLDLSRRYRDYSHGNKQKLLLVQAFMHGPRLVVLDEPTLGLDPVMQREFRQLIRETASTGATVFLSSHVLSEVEKACDRIAIIAQGRLRRVGTMSELRQLSVHNVEATIDSSLEPSRLVAIPGVSDVQVENHHVRCRVRGRVAPLLEVLNAAGVVEIDSQEMSLEELFLEQYSQPLAS